MAIPFVPPPPLPPELVRWTMRTPTAADVDRILALQSDVEVAVIGRSMASRANIEHDLTSADALADTAQVLVEHDGDAACLAWIRRVHDDHYITDLPVHPSVTQGDGDRLVAWALDWFERVARAGEPRAERLQLGSWSFEDDAERARRLRAHGYAADRPFLLMTRDLDGADEWPGDPDAVTVRLADIRRGEPAHGDARLVHELISTSFADHYNYQPTPFEKWFAQRTDDPGFAPGWWWIAELDGRPLGAMIMTHEMTGENAGYVHYVGVLREARGHGLAKALLHKGFMASREHGYATVKLFVDAESPTGATALYDSIGMTRELVTLDWQKWLEL